MFHLSCQDSNYYDQKIAHFSNLQYAMMLACSEVPVSSSAKAFYPTRTYNTKNLTWSIIHHWFYYGIILSACLCKLHCNHWISVLDSDSTVFYDLSHQAPHSERCNFQVRTNDSRATHSNALKKIRRKTNKSNRLALPPCWKIDGKETLD